MTFYGFPNDDFALIYCSGKISLLDMKMMVCLKKSYHFSLNLSQTPNLANHEDCDVMTHQARFYHVCIVCLDEIVLQGKKHFLGESHSI